MNIKRGEEAVGSDISYKWCEVITFYHQKRWQISQLSLLILEFQFHDSPPIVLAQGFKVSSCNLQAVNWLLSSTGNNQYQIFLKMKTSTTAWKASVQLTRQRLRMSYQVRSESLEKEPWEAWERHERETWKKVLRPERDLRKTWERPERDLRETQERPMRDPRETKERSNGDLS